MSELVCSIFCVKSIRHLIICGLFTLFFLVVVVVVGCSVFFFVCLLPIESTGEWIVVNDWSTLRSRRQHTSFGILFVCFTRTHASVDFKCVCYKHPSVSMFCSAVFCVVSIPVIHLIVNCFSLDGMINPYPKRSLRREREREDVITPIGGVDVCRVRTIANQNNKSWLDEYLYVLVSVSCNIKHTFPCILFDWNVYWAIISM